MQLTRFTDYSLRTLIFVGMQNDRLVTIHEVAEHYGISKMHLVKVVHRLGLRGYIETVRGRDGGIRLARRPELINVGAVIRDTEENMNIAECFGGNKSCALLPSCVLKSAFAEARKNFLATLDAYHLSDLLVGKARAKEPPPSIATIHVPAAIKKKLAVKRLQPR
jgi:Rrf2 family transcriptional regulator, nitric oxide-sensitive transcriptional repressor